MSIDLPWLCTFQLAALVFYLTTSFWPWLVQASFVGVFLVPGVPISQETNQSWQYMFQLTTDPNILST